MYRSTFDVFRWILGARSKLFGLLTENLHQHLTPELEENRRLHCFEAFTLEAFGLQTPASKVRRDNHFSIAHIALETQHCLQQTNSSPEVAKVMKRIICLCILIRDFDDVREYVECKCAETIVITRSSLPAVDTGETDAEMVQRKATILANNIPWYAAVGPEWDLVRDTWKSCQWASAVAKVNMEAHLMLCGEIIKHHHNVRDAITAFCQAYTCPNGQAKYAPERVLAWYRHENDTEDMQMICDMHMFKSSHWTRDYMCVPPAEAGMSYEKELTTEVLRVVSAYCSTIVSRIGTTVLNTIIPINLYELREIGLFYQRIRDMPVAQQRYQIETRMHRVSSCVHLHRACAEMERCLRMYVYMNHIQSTSHTAALISHLIQNKFFSASDDVYVIFQKWMQHDHLASENSLLSAGILQWAGSGFAEFCQMVNVHLRGLHPAEIMLLHDDGTTSDASHLLDLGLSHEMFEDFDA